MEFRSSNVTGYNHHLGDIVSNVGSSHGVQLSGGSTGGVVEAVGDDANVSLTVRGKGTGAVRIGNSSSPALIGGSTGSVSLFQVSLFQWTIPALTTSGIAPVESTETFAGMTTNAAYFVSQRSVYNSTLATSLQIAVRPSTGGLRVTHFNHGASSLSGSTASAYILRVGF